MIRITAAARRRVAILLAATAVTGGSAVLMAAEATAASSCPQNVFCAYDSANYGGELLRSIAGRGSNRVDVADDRVSSVRNNTGNRWDGVTVRRGQPDQVVYRFAPRTDVSWVGSNANDRIDHFDVR